MKVTIEQIENMGSDSLLVFGGKFEGGINIQQVPEEITDCLNDIIDSGKEINNFLEIGSAAGGSTVLFNDIFDLENVVIIDDNFHWKHNLRPGNLKGIKGNVKEFIGNSRSQEAITFIKKLKIKFDIILIDGDHSFEAVMDDAKNYAQFLNKGGFLFFHDIFIIKSAGMAVDEIIKTGNYKVKKYVAKTKPQCGIALLRS